MSPTTTAPDPTAPATVAFAPDDLPMQDQPANVTSGGVVEREKLRLEFEAIIAAGYGGGADEPRPPAVPPGHRDRGGAARSPVPRCRSARTRPVRLRPAPTAGPAPRERGPPVACTAAVRSAQLFATATVRPASPRDRGRRHRVDRGPGRRRGRPSPPPLHRGGYTCSGPAPRPHGAPISATGARSADPTRDPHNGPSGAGSAVRLQAVSLSSPDGLRVLSTRRPFTVPCRPSASPRAVGRCAPPGRPPARGRRRAGRARRRAPGSGRPRAGRARRSAARG